MKKEKALLIVNPKAGQCKAKNNIFGIIEGLSTKYILTVHLTESGEDAINTVRSAAGEFDTIICCGGDGTLSQTVNGCADFEYTPKIGYLPCGTANDVASTLGLPKNMSLCAKRVAFSSAKPHDVGLFCNESRFVYVASFGVFTKSSYDTPQSVKNALGHSAYVFSGAMDLMNVKKTPTKIICDDKELVFDDVVLLSVCNTKSVGGIIKFPDNKVSLGDGKLELLVVRYPTNITMWNDILTALSQKKFTSHGENVMLLHGSHFEIITKENVAWTLDGEGAGEHSRASIDCLKGAVNLIY